jgi:hypothetical protein
MPQICSMDGGISEFGAHPGRGRFNAAFFQTLRDSVIGQGHPYARSVRLNCRTLLWWLAVDQPVR